MFIMTVETSEHAERFNHLDNLDEYPRLASIKVDESKEAIVDALESHDADLAHAAATVHVAGLETWIRSQEPGWSALAARAVHGT